MSDASNDFFRAPPNANRSNRRRIAVAVLVACGAVAVYFLLPVLTVVFVAQPVRVAGNAMAPTLKNGDRILVSKQLGSLERGDIVVFYHPEDPTRSLIERIIGLPGDTIDSDLEGHVTINSQTLKEDYLNPSLNKAARSRWDRVRAEWKEIKPGYYFLMGDNRDASNDSRSWGLVPFNLIYGKYVFRYWASAEN